MISRTLSIQFSGDALAACHEARGLLHQPSGTQLLVVESFHSELTHVSLCQGNGWMFKQLSNLRQFPGPGTPGVLVEEVLSSLKLSVVQRTTEVDVLNGLGLLCFVLHLPSWVVAIHMQAELLRYAEPCARW